MLGVSGALLEALLVALVVALVADLGGTPGRL